MKKIIILVALLIIALSSCAKEITWYKNIDEAVGIAKDTNKTVFIHFTGSDWCVWCQRLESEVYSKDIFKEYAENNLVMVKLDFPKRTPQSNDEKLYNNSQAKKYQIQGFPTVILLNQDGEKIAQTGYQRGGPENYVSHLKSLIAEKTEE